MKNLPYWNLRHAALLVYVCTMAQTTACGPEQVSAPDKRTVSITLTPAQIAQRQAQVEDWFNQRMDGWEIVDTRETSDGQVIDYVTIESMFPEDPDAPYQEPPSMIELPEDDGSFTHNEQLDDDMQQGLTTFQTDGGLEPPQGTLPVIRPDFHHFIHGIGIPESVNTLEEFFNYLAKPFPQTPLPAGVNNKRLYGSHIESTASMATYGTVSLWDYQGVQSGDMTLLQTAELCWGSGSNTLEAIELGVQELPGLYNTNKPHFFVFFRTGGGTTGNRLGGYNLDQKGFIPYSKAAFPVGAAFNTSKTSTVNGTQWECKMGTQMHEGNWWVYACGSWLGYYPGPNSQVNENLHIPFDLIDDEACQTHWYGEVFDPDPSTWTTADMGSGQFASQGWRKAAYLRNMYQGHTAAPSSWFDSTLSTGTYNPNCYSATEMRSASNAPWRRYFWIGGPGFNDNCQ